MAVWREIWQESIATGKETLIKNDQKGKLFEELKQKYPKDAMIIFEEAIAYDCQKNYKKLLNYMKKHAMNYLYNIGRITLITYEKKQR